MNWYIMKEKKGYREEQEKKNGGRSTQRDEVPQWREKIETGREGGTEKESLIRHQSSSEGGRETLTTDTGGGWCQNRVIQYTQSHHENAHMSRQQ